jgi:hypothetical protein
MQFNYSLKIQDKSSQNLFLDIPPYSGITTTYTVSRNLIGSPNEAKFEIYNLTNSEIASIWRDRLSITTDKNIGNLVFFSVGYNDNIYQVFTGTLIQTQYKKRGVDSITTLICRDNAYTFYGNKIKLSYSKDTKRIDLITLIIKQIPFLEVGVIDGIDEEEIMGVGGMISGNGFETLTKLIQNNTIFIDNGVLNITPADAPTGRVSKLISSDVLIEAPMRSNTQLVCNTMLLPEIGIGDLATVESEVFNHYNGSYIVDGITHTGIIAKHEVSKSQTTIFLRYPISNAK